MTQPKKTFTTETQRTRCFKKPVGGFL